MATILVLATIVDFYTIRVLTRFLILSIVVNGHFSGIKHYCGTLRLLRSLRDILFIEAFLKYGQYFGLRRYCDSNLAFQKHGHYLDFDQFYATLPLSCFFFATI